MSLSSYQMERVLLRLRRWADWLGWPPPTDGSVDRVELSGKPRVPPRTPHAARAFPPAVAEVAEADGRTPVVEAERERRAGSFMQPPYPVETPAIPRLRRVASPRPTPHRTLQAD